MTGLLEVKEEEIRPRRKGVGWGKQLGNWQSARTKIGSGSK